MVWASKEATFKLLSQNSIRSHFVPREFDVDISGIESLNFESRLNVSHLGLKASVKIHAAKHWAHAIATFSEFNVVRWSVRQIVRGSADPHNAQIESESVRRLAGELLSIYGKGNLILEFEGKIPRVRSKTGGRSEIGVSLSHHGAFLGAAIAFPRDFFSCAQDCAANSNFPLGEMSALPS